MMARIAVGKLMMRRGQMTCRDSNYYYYYYYTEKTKPPAALSSCPAGPFLSLCILKQRRR